MTGAEDGARTAHESASPNSALVWIPAMERAADHHKDVHVPETEFVDIDAQAAGNWIDGDPEGFNFGDVVDAAERLRYPVFVRTDITSAKHQGMAGIRARDEDELRTAVRWALESNFMAMGIPQPKAIVVRDWIELSLGFYDDAQITDSKRQIAREFRAFATPDEHLCTHFYWPEDSIHSTECDDWRERLESMAELSEYEEAVMADYATTVAEIVPKAAPWSVDFGIGSHGAIYAIDMALGNLSWHPECPEKARIEGGKINV